MDTLSQIARFIRWKDWGPGKLTILLSLCLYFVVAYNLPFDRFAVTFVVFMAFAVTQSVMGYVLNDWGDRELDRRQFKKNAFNGKSTLECVLALTLVLVMAFITGLPLILRPGFGILWLAWAAAATAYSLEPVRLKTRGVAGLAVSFVAQWFLPVLIAFAAFEVAGGLDMWIMALSLTICGATLELAHQRYDRARDMLTRAETFAAGLTDLQVNRAYALALTLDKLSIGLYMTVVLLALVKIQTRWSAALAVLLGVTYVVLLLFTLRGSLHSIRTGEVNDPYYGPRTEYPSPARLLHETLLNFGIPVVLGVAAALQAPLYGILLGLFLFWRVVLGGADWVWPLRAIKARIDK